ncbi:hypothetical protein G7028_27675 [Pseudomonas carnis]|nr:hypothetical protein [Pseudomonas carnis]MBJ2204444.1 hypothetical protein [Pseudomonas carnis]
MSGFVGASPPDFRQALENRDDAIEISTQSAFVHWRAGGSRSIGREHCVDAALPAATDSSGSGVLDPVLAIEQNRQAVPVNGTDQREQPKACTRWLLSHLFFGQTLSVATQAGTFSMMIKRISPSA